MSLTIFVHLIARSESSASFGRCSPI
jgi:hypothetical protein